MEARFEGAKLLAQEDGFWLAVKPLSEDMTRVRRWLMEKHTGVQTLTVKKYRRKRSLTANAYAWVLLDKLAEATGAPKEEVYRRTIREMGGVSELLAIREEAVSQFIRSWGEGHIGQFCEDLGVHSTGYRLLRCYYGSSTYDTAQMARLIDALVQDCEALGIDTMSDQERSLLLERWDAEKNKGP